MPSKSGKQARLMRAVAHGWEPDRVEGPTKKVAREFVRADKNKQRGGGVSKKRMARSLESSPRIPVEELDRIREALGQSPEQNALDKFVKNPRLPEGELEKLRELVESRQGMKRKNPRLPEDELEKLRELMKSGQGAERTNSSSVLSKEELAKLRDVISRSR